MPSALKTIVGRITGSRQKTPKKIELQNASDELRRNPLAQQAIFQMSEPKRAIETVIPDKAVTEKLIARVIGQWEELSSEPYWSNANLEENKAAKIGDRAIRAFFDEGTHWMKTLEAFESRSGVTIPNGTCVELGSGTGKYTHALARRFAKVIAIDVSAGHLAVSDDYLRKQGLTNVESVALKSPYDLDKFPNVDLFLGLAVFPHNAPPIQRILLESALAQVNPGGFALFQIQEWMRNYTYSTQRFLDGAPEAMCDCHCLPKTDVLEILRDSGFELLDFVPDFFAECIGSYTFFARKGA